MQITRIRSRVVDLPLPAPFHPAWARGRNQTNVLMVLVEVETDAGITGHTARACRRRRRRSASNVRHPLFRRPGPDARVERLTAVLRDAEILGPPVYFMEIAAVGHHRQAGRPAGLSTVGRLRRSA